MKHTKALSVLATILFGIAISMPRSLAEDCGQACHHVVGYQYTAPSSTEYDPFFAKNDLRGGSDGGVYKVSTYTYKFKKWNIGDTWCTNCGNTCLGSADPDFGSDDWSNPIGSRTWCNNGSNGPNNPWGG